MDLSIIIVSWNVKEKLRNNLKKLQNSRTDLAIEIFVVDNASSDDSAKMVKKDFPQVRLIENDENLGFSKANNQAFRKTRGDFILLLNPDMEVNDDTLENMVSWMRSNEQADIAGCRLKDEQGKDILHVRRFPTVWDQLFIALKIPHIFPGVLSRYLQKGFDYSCQRQVDSVRGGFFMIRRESLGMILPEKRIKRGEILDERYFIWFEEVDLCRQTKETEGQVWYTPEAECLDHIGQSFAQVGSFKKQKYFKDSMIKYFKKWHSGWQVAVLQAGWPLGLALTWVMEKIGAGGKRKNS